MAKDLEHLAHLPDDQIICYCQQVNKGTIVRAIRAGARTLNDLQRVTTAGAGNRCRELNPHGRCCHPELKGLLAIYANSPEGGSGKCACCHHKP